MDRWHLSYQEVMELPARVADEMLLVMEAEGNVDKEPPPKR